MNLDDFEAAFFDLMVERFGIEALVEMVGDEEE